MKKHLTDGSACWCNPNIIETNGSNIILHKELVLYKQFFEGVLNGNITLCNDIDGEVMASWKAGGQDFTIYGKYNHTTHS